MPLLRQSDAPAVVNVSSVAGIGGEGSSVAYAASKGALNTMTKSLARGARSDSGERGLSGADRFAVGCGTS